MSNFLKKIKDAEAIAYINKITGKKPKHRCPKCHMFTLYKIVKKESVCCWCNNTGKLRKITDGDNSKKIMD